MKIKTEFSLSISDLLLIPAFKEAYGNNDVDKIKQILFENGMDTSCDIEESKSCHRNLQNKVVNCVRYEGYERQDVEWLKSGACSKENLINACEDRHLRVELKMMGRQSNHTGDMIETIKNHSIGE